MERNFNTTADTGWDKIKNKLQECCRENSIDVNGTGVKTSNQNLYWNKFEQVTGKSKTQLKDELNRFV